MKTKSYESGVDFAFVLSGYIKMNKSVKESNRNEILEISIDNYGFSFIY